MRSAVSFGHVIAGCGKMDHFSHICRVVANPFNIAGNEQQLSRAADSRGVFDHVAHQIAEDAVVERVHLFVAGNDFSGHYRITRRIGRQHVVYHLGCDLAQGRHIAMPMRADDAAAWLTYPTEQPEIASATLGGIARRS